MGRFELSEEEVREILAMGEGRTVEFKQGLARDEKVARTLCAFANTRGGILLVGVGDRGEVLGAGKVEEVLARLAEIARGSVEPSLEVEVGRIDVDAKALVWCSVPIGPKRPYAAAQDHSKEVVVRVGSRNRSATLRDQETIRLESGAAPRDPDLAREVLAWAETRTFEKDRTRADFRAHRKVGEQRIRTVFSELELTGQIIGHGINERRVYSRVRRDAP